MSVLTDDNHMWDELVAGLSGDEDFRMALWCAEAEELSDQVETLREEATREGFRDLEHLDERLRFIGARLEELKRRRRGE